MNIVMRSIVLLLFASVLAGCGGGVSQKDMLERAKALKRQKDEEDENEVQQLSEPNVTNVVAKSDETLNPKVDSPEISESKESTLPEPVDVDAPPPALSANEREARIVESLTRISNAFKEFSDANRNALPMNARFVGKIPVLSWRVEILPLLGHTELYKKFNRNESWDSDHNLKLLPLIPDVYKSTAVGGFKTTYLVPSGGNTAFQGRKVVALNRIEDGVANTVFLVNSAPELAVEWTKPQDWEIRGSLTDKVADVGLGGFYVAWGNGRISKLRNDLKDQELYALLSIDNGELIQLSKVIAKDANSEAADLLDMGRADLAKLDAERAKAAAASGEDPVVDLPVEGMGYEDAVEALNEGLQRKAFQIYHASIVIQKDDKQVMEKFRWVPVLKRPVSSVRFGLVIKANRRAIRANVAPIPVKNTASYEPVEGPGVQLIDHFCGDLGQRSMRILIEAAEAGTFGSFVAENATTSVQGRTVAPRRKMKNVNLTANDIEEYGFPPMMLHPGIEVLGILNRTDAIAVAKRRELDILVIYDVSLQLKSDGEVNNTARIELVDVETNESFYETQAFNNRSIAVIRRDPTREDPIIEEMQKLAQFVTTLFDPVPYPKLQPEHVEARIARLIDGNPQNPLAAMAEIRLYLAKGLISRHDAWQGMRKLNAETESLLPAQFEKLTYANLAMLVDEEEE